MAEVIFTNIANILAALLITLIGVLGAWLSKKLAARAELSNIAEATKNVVTLAELTVSELQQTVVDGLKEANSDGRLTKEEVTELGNLLVQKTIDKMSKPTYELLNAAGVDIVELIRAAGEAKIYKMRPAY